jgi:steroid delta-isomerase-like uncharacterized protein
MADSQANKALVREVFEQVFTRRDAGLAAKYYAVDYVQHNPRVPPGLAGIQTFLRYLFDGFAELHAELVLTLAEDDRVMTLVDWRGTHTGTFAGVPATGKEIRFRSAEVFRIQDGMLVEHWDAVDNTEAMLAIGALKPGDA